MNNPQTLRDLADELEYLSWFYVNSDFGPGDYDVMLRMEERYEKSTGKKVPKNFTYKCENNSEIPEQNSAKGV